MSHFAAPNHAAAQAMRIQRRLFCLLAAGASQAIPAALAQATSSALTFEVASVKQNRDSIGTMLTARTGVRYVGRPLRQILSVAYDAKTYQILGPPWLDEDRFDVIATAPPGSTLDQVRVMLQNLMVDRFRIVLQIEKRSMPVYALIVGPRGFKLKESGDPSVASQTAFGGDGLLEARTTGNLAHLLSRFMDRPVLDFTGLNGVYDIKLKVSTDDLPGLKTLQRPRSPDQQPTSAVPPVESEPLPTIFMAVRALGLKLENRQEPIQCYVVEQAGRMPTPK